MPTNIKKIFKIKCNLTVAISHIPNVFIINLTEKYV